MFEALVMMLFNTATKTFHPIMYREKMFCGGIDSEPNQNLVRFKSTGHRTTGFLVREDAIASIQKELVEVLEGQGYKVTVEIEGDLMWDGVDLPTDTQIRSRK